ncbi:hypothetical protein [Sporohalobacter salinus]|uniref:hypothetical protein n=1 Tax=Sporohalobacter salinus TaxID=1494606 RepID=UPI0019606349|nr:hypothetical protein [Sporohalobacter salinus]MBM7624863.1 hypothetical protein [Sporohalobacter salinus]
MDRILNLDKVIIDYYNIITLNKKLQKNHIFAGGIGMVGYLNISLNITFSIGDNLEGII